MRRLATGRVEMRRRLDCGRPVGGSWRRGGSRRAAHGTCGRLVTLAVAYRRGACGLADLRLEGRRGARLAGARWWRAAVTEPVGRGPEWRRSAGAAARRSSARCVDLRRSHGGRMRWGAGPWRSTGGWGGLRVLEVRRLTGRSRMCAARWIPSGPEAMAVMMICFRSRKLALESTLLLVLPFCFDFVG